MDHLLAQKLTLPGTPNLVGPLGDKNVTIGTILSNIYKFALPIAGIVLLIMIISAGFTLLTSAGDAKKMEKGKQTLTYGVVGFVIIFLAYWITQLLGIVFGITAIGDTFK
ncbi:MAG: pilin [Candidatus Gottesmanbacteria bacterium]